MLIPIIKDFNNAFSYLVSNSVEKTKEVFDPISKSVLESSQDQQSGAINDIFHIVWAVIRICFLFLVQTIQYIISFQWLRDFRYLPIAIPNNRLDSNQNNIFIQKFNNSVVSLIGDRQNILQRFLFSGNHLTNMILDSHQKSRGRVLDIQNTVAELVNHQTISKPETGLTISDQSLAYTNFILGLPNVTPNGAPLNSWSLSFLSNKWFDPLTVPVNFLSSYQGSSSHDISQFSSIPEQITRVTPASDFRITNIILMSILICITTGFSSFFNSFFIFFPLSLSNLLSLRYLIIQKFWAGCVSVLGIVFGEIVFMLFLVLPPPFIQITLSYLESVWPYIIGLSLIIFIIFDLISNPYTNTMSLYQSNNQILSSTSTSPLGGSQATKQSSGLVNNNLTRKRKWWNFLPIKLGNHTAKIFGFSFLLALTEQSCYFSFFGTLNLSSTGNFLDTYLFAASKSPMILMCSCVGFLIGSFLAITIYNLIIAKIIFLFASVAIKIKQYNPDLISNWMVKRETNFKKAPPRNSMKGSKNFKNDSVSQTKFVIFRIYTSVKNIISNLGYLFSNIKSKDSFKFLVLRLKNIIQLFISYLPGGKRIVFFLFPTQAHSSKSNFQSTSETFKSSGSARRFTGPQSLGKYQNLDFNSKADQPLTGFDDQKSKNLSRETTHLGQSQINFKTNSAATFLSIETTIENMLRSNFLNMSSLSLPSRPANSKETLERNNQLSGNTSQLGGSAFYNKIDKVLLTCLITLSFTTIPYYSFDYLINNFFGFIPQDQILNSHSLRVNFPDYTNLLGITLSDNNSVINTDVSLYDRAHFMYGEWPNSFESLNYQGELMWTNLRDHRRQKRTRRSTRLKFKTLKTKISTSWKEFKQSSGFSGSTRGSRFSDQTKPTGKNGYDFNVSNTVNSDNARVNSKINNKNTFKNLAQDSSQQQNFPISSLQIDKKAQSNLRNTNNLSNVFYKIFLAAPFKQSLIYNNKSERQTYDLAQASLFVSPDGKTNNAKNTGPLRGNTSKVTNQFENMELEPNFSTRKNDFNQNNDKKKSLSKTFESISPTKNVSQNEIMPKIPEEIRRSTSLNETIKPLSTSTFIDLSGGEKYIKTYPKNWKRVITEKYYQNPIYKTILSNDLKNFLKREPLTQQLTNKQENELYFLRVKMAHYYDSLRFYFNLKEQINNTRSKVQGADLRLNGYVPYARFNENRNASLLSDTKKNSLPLDSWSGNVTSSQKQNVSKASDNSFSIVNDKNTFEKIWNDKRQSKISSTTQNKYEPIVTRPEESLKNPPFQFKSMTSMNYRQQFKGTLKTVKQLFAISLISPVSSFSNSQSERNFAWDTDYDFVDKESTQPINAFSSLTGGTEPIEKSYKYDKSLFNEYSYDKNEFLHEEGRTVANRKSNNASNFRESASSNTIGSSSGTKGSMSLNEPTGSRTYRGIGLATKNIYNMFGSNDPFYVGWDENLRKFVLTSRILSRSSALNYNTTTSKFNVDKNKKQGLSIQEQVNFNNDKPVDHSSLSNSTNQRKNRNYQKQLNRYSDVPVYSSPAFSGTKSAAKGWNIINSHIENFKGSLRTEKKSNSNQQSVQIYRPYTSWPFFKHELKNLPNRPYFVLYENYLNVLNKRIHLFRNININDIDTKSLTFLYSYSFNNNVKKYVSQLPINIYKQSMRPSSLENLFTPTSNARSSFLWPGEAMPAWEYYFW